MRNALEELAKSEGGKRFLINLLESLNLRHVAPERAREVISAVGQIPNANMWDQHKGQIAGVIFARPDDFQFCGPPAAYSPGEWMTIKSMSDLLFFLRRADGTMDPAVANRLGVSDPTGPHHGFNEEHYLRFADALSDEDDAVRFLLARAFPNPAMPGTRRPAPSWYSRWCECGFRDSLTYPSKDASGRFRDWLGLPYGIDEPLFVLRSRRPIAVSTLQAHRPTPWEGFDNPLYKHRTTTVRDAESCGSTADLYKLRADGSVDADVEGGPEMVSRGVTFDPADFVCEFIGTAPAICYDLFGATFSQVLLRTGQTVDWIVEELGELLWPSHLARTH